MKFLKLCMHLKKILLRSYIESLMNTAPDILSNKRPLTGIGILVTRAIDQAESLCKLIEKNGGRAIRYPVIEIVPIELHSSIDSIFEQLGSYDMAIFISANAVHHALRAVRTKHDFPKSLNIVAIGHATKMALEEGGLKVSIVPDQQFDSDALLALPQMRQVKGKKILIFRGKGGRELLKDTLQKRGAHIDYAELYQRTLPVVKTNDLGQYWEQNAIDMVTVTSNQALDNLFEIAGKNNIDHLTKIPLVVISQRMLQHAREKGFQANIMVADEVSDAAILDALRKLHQAHEQE